MGEGFIVRRGGGGQQTVKPIYNSLTEAGFTSLTLSVTNDSNSIATLYYSVVNNEPAPDQANTFDTEFDGQETKDITITGLTEGTTYTVYLKAIAIGEFPSETVIVTDLTTGVPMQATGGTITTPTIGGVQYKVHAFTNVGTSTFTVTDIGALGGEVEYLIVAGGGGGGNDNSGGGGAGGLLQGSFNPSATNYTITVGDGGDGGLELGYQTRGDGNVEPGDNSSAFGLTAIGGGNGASADPGLSGGGDGGSGGGGIGNTDGSTKIGLGTPGQGNNGAGGTGGGGGGGGGAGQPGQSGSGTRGGDGGDGLFIDWADAAGYGDNGYFAGGGAGGNENNISTLSFGGLGGGGDAALSQNSVQPGQPNTGGGGGGGTHSSSAGRKGGSGIVIIRYALQEVS